MNAATATATAHPNIALVKYWGKRNLALNLPAAGSISITLDELRTRTTVTLDRSLVADQVTLNGRTDDRQRQRVSACVDRLRALAGVDTRVRVDSDNNFPTAAGLASSASGFAALVAAAAAALGVPLDDRALSVQARMGSGSAARSIFGGYVEMRAGVEEDGSDAWAEPLLPASDWPLRVVIAVTSTAPKADSSSAGMERSRLTSPYYPAWVASTRHDLAGLRTAIRERDFEALAEIAEHSCLKMHAAMLATRPPLVYWNAATMGAIQRLRELRGQGVPAFFTIDAGPQVKAVCEPAAEGTVAAAMREIPGVESVRVVGLGGPVRVEHS